MNTITESYVNELIDFAPTAEARRMGFAESQRMGTVAVFNRLVRNKVAYVADEVGLGKTYIALAVMGLLRTFDASSRIVVLTPRENIQLKWIKELRNFVRLNWRVADNRFRGLDDRPVRRPIPCARIDDIARVLRTDDHADLFLRSGTFSLSVKSADARKRARKRLLPFVPWVDKSLLDGRLNDSDYRDNYGRVLNALIPEIDLLIVDEAHNFKHGFHPRVSNRNRILGMALGHQDGRGEDCRWYGSRVKRLLLLSATPFEYDYADLLRQLQVFGKGRLKLVDAKGGDPRPVADLGRDIDSEAKRELVSRLMVRRVSYLKIAGETWTKNRYRREWRHGGYLNHDDSMQLNDPKQRLVVGLIQKKLAELLGDRRFNNAFQIGMLSSFESFLETLGRSRLLGRANAKPGDGKADNEEDDPARVFDGDQTEDAHEKQGIDSTAVESVVRSYRKRFGRGLPHPKLDATAEALGSSFETGDKALVFVRRVATTGELKAKLDRYYDTWVRRRLYGLLPERMHGELAGLFDLYEKERLAVARRRRGDTPEHAREDENDQPVWPGLDADDTGDTESFFGWFFRGDGPPGVLSGAAFQKNRSVILLL